MDNYNATFQTEQIKPLNSSTLVDFSTGEIIPRPKFTRNGVSKVVRSPFDARTESRSIRYSLQTKASAVLTGERVCKCNRVKVSDNVGVMTSKIEGESRSHYSGLMQCGSVWHCPVCAPKISERRGSELRQAFDSASLKGWKISHFVFTFPHRADQPLKSNLDLFLSAYKKFWDSKPIRRFVDSYGLEGRIRALEVTYNFKNGWHPHIHLLVFSTSDLPPSLSSDLYPIWAEKCQSVGLSKPSLKHGLVIQDGSSAGEYINKFSDDSKLTKNGDSVTWDLADEITKMNSKTSNSGFTPFDFLRVLQNPTAYGFDVSDTPMFRSLFKEYATCFKGKSQIEWGRGKNWDLRSKLGLSKAQTDQELVELQEEKASLTVVLTNDEWSLVRGSYSTLDNRPSLLTVAERDGFDGIVKFLFGLTKPSCSLAHYRNSVLFRNLTMKDRVKNPFIKDHSSSDFLESSVPHLSSVTSKHSVRCQLQPTSQSLCNEQLNLTLT